MMRKPPKWTQGFVDRHGKPRWYFRRPGFPRVALSGLPWSPGFMADYENALYGQKSAIGATRTPSGSLAALIVLYYDSADFKRLRPSTRATYTNIIERLRAYYGDLPVNKIERKHIKAIVEKRAADTPTAANRILSLFKILMALAVDREWIAHDPTIGIKKTKIKSGGFRAWTEEDIQHFEAKHAVGSRARLALALLIFTAQRRSDVVLMGWQHVRAGRLAMRQQKTGSDFNIPLHPELSTILNATPRGQMTFLVTAQGKPFTPAGFGNWFREMCNRAALPECSAHGLRKAASRRLAEANASAHEIMSVTGHRSLKEVTRYTESANRAGLADTAIGRLAPRSRPKE